MWSYRIHTRMYIYIFCRLCPRSAHLKTVEEVLLRRPPTLPVYSHAFPVSDAARLPPVCSEINGQRSSLNSILLREIVDCTDLFFFFPLIVHLSSNLNQP